MTPSPSHPPPPPGGVILAGGRGARMDAMQDVLPKCLLPIGNVPIVERQILQMREVGVRQIVLVVGHLDHLVRDALGDGSRWGVRLRYVHQEHPHGIAHAAGLCEPLVQGPFLLFLGDIHFVAPDLAEMLEMMASRDLGAVLAVKEEEDLSSLQKGYAVVRADDDRVQRVVEKPRHPTTRLKGCGLYLFDVSFFDAIRRTPRSALRDEYEITDAIQVFIDDGRRVEAAQIVEYDINLTDPRDLWKANMRCLQDRGQESIVDVDAVVEVGATVQGSVVGPGARIAAGTRVRRSVVLADCLVEQDVMDTVVTPHGRFGMEPCP